MKKLGIIVTILLMSMILLVGCGKSKADELSTMREVSWEGTELTVTVGTNQSSGCKWNVSFEDDSIIDYSVNRVFHLVVNKEGKSIGYSDIGFEGKKKGTTTITLTTPCDWDGNGNGYKYVVTVTVNEDGTIQSAEGKDI
ncbi:hypothetical protein [Intestinibacter sp.]